MDTGISGFCLVVPTQIITVGRAMPSEQAGHSECPARITLFISRDFRNLDCVVSLAFKIFPVVYNVATAF
jgi:hypothetical protein